MGRCSDTRCTLCAVLCTLMNKKKSLARWPSMPCNASWPGGHGWLLSYPAPHCHTLGIAFHCCRGVKNGNGGSWEGIKKKCKGSLTPCLCQRVWCVSIVAKRVCLVCNFFFLALTVVPLSYVFIN
jgi:hypothetical protein